nr:MAG TPA: hypothetical protein [Caudoviricetes sp.]
MTWKIWYRWRRCSRPFQKEPQKQHAWLSIRQPSVRRYRAFDRICASKSTGKHRI